MLTEDTSKPVLCEANSRETKQKDVPLPNILRTPFETKGKYLTGSGGKTTSKRDRKLLAHVALTATRRASKLLVSDAIWTVENITRARIANMALRVTRRTWYEASIVASGAALDELTVRTHV